MTTASSQRLAARARRLVRWSASRRRRCWLCGALSELPTMVGAVASADSAMTESLVTPTPSPVSSDTGGYRPGSRADHRGRGVGPGGDRVEGRQGRV